MSIILGRLALLSALSALVLGVLWTHIKRKVWLIFDTLSAYIPLSVLLVARGRLDRAEHLSNEQDVITRDHPKFSDRSFERTTSQSIRSAYRSLYGIGQSQSQSSFANEQPPGFHLGASHPSAPGGHPISNQIGAVQQGGQYSTLLIFFVTTTVPLIIYTALRVLRARFGGSNQLSRRRYSSLRSGAATNEAKMGRADSVIDKRRLVRLSREERVRELIIHHGGRNVSSAVRFLAKELERNKRLLMASLASQTNVTCHCSCHADGEKARTPAPVERTTGEEHTASKVMDQCD